MHADVEYTLLGHAFVAYIPSDYERLKLQVEYNCNICAYQQ